MNSQRRRPLRTFGLLILAGLGVNLWSEPSRAAIKLEVDATEAPRKILHTRLDIPAEPGPLTLFYPKWIPGDHAPDGPLVDLAGMKVAALGKPIPWRRDLENMYAFHVTVPPGANSLNVQLDFLISPPPPGASSWGGATSQLVVLSWEEVLLYPQGPPAATLRYEPTLRLPADWRFGTALPIQKQSGSMITFDDVALGELIDSPLIAGAHFRAIPLNPGEMPPHEIDIVADNEEALTITPAIIAHYNALITQTGLLYSSRHYRDYHFLLTLSDDVAHFGLEHQESSDDRVSERTFLDQSLFLTQANLLPHEFTHSWNGKYRRPAGLTAADYQQPVTGDLLWIYEGLTQYLGDVLTARSNLWTREQFQDELAYVAATLDHRPGRTWRPLQDTADSVQVLASVANDQILSSTAEPWTAWRRSTDYYDEGTLIWLEVDTTLRKLTNDRSSLDDFCRRFFGGPGGVPELKTYTIDDVVATLNDLAPYRWLKFFRDRLDSTAAHAPLGGIENGGWQLVYTEVPNPMLDASEIASQKIDLSFSIGAVLNDDGTIRDVIPGMAAAQAGFGPDMKILGVNGKLWSAEVMRKAIAATATSNEPLELLIVYGKRYQTYRLNYHGGLRYPHLERQSTRRDLLTEIIQPRNGR